jgi:large subunit ribosomal protein L21
MLRRFAVSSAARTAITPHLQILDPITVSHPQSSEQSGNNGLFAVIECAGSQHKVSVGDQVMVHRLNEFQVGQEAKFDKVLLVGSRDFSIFGRPYVRNCEVRAEVQEHTQLGKINVFKKRRRKGYKRYRGFRASVSVFQVTGIDFVEQQEEGEH